MGPRARTAARPAVPFTTHIPGQALISLLQAGWVPVSVIFGISLGSRHDDLRTLSHPDGSADTRRELRAYSQLVKDTRQHARTRLGHAAGELGAEGVLVHEVTVRVTERECPKLRDEHDLRPVSCKRGLAPSDLAAVKVRLSHARMAPAGSPVWLPHHASAIEHEDAVLSLRPGQERPHVRSWRPGRSRERPAHPRQVSIGKVGPGQVRASEIVQGTVRERLRHSLRRRDAEAACQPCAQTLSRVRARSPAWSRERPITRPVLRTSSRAGLLLRPEARARACARQ